MENATKALLIAAAVLIAILLISLGVGVFNSASEQMDKADLSEYEAQKFNDKFTPYAGTNISGSDVNALVEAVVNSNNAPGQTNFVQVTGAVTVNKGVVNTYPNKVPTAGRYTVTITMASGLVSQININGG